MSETQNYAAGATEAAAAADSAALTGSTPAAQPSQPPLKKIATRESYGNALVELGREHDDLIVLDADLSAATKTGLFAAQFPARHIECGIAEANMMDVAAGMSTMGYVPFASTFAMFAAGRAFEQVRNSIGYPHLNVKIGATHGGLSVGEDGASHQCCEDFALMRAIPGMTVICPADDVEARAAVKAAYEYVGPVYLRFGRLAVPVFHSEENYHFEIGKGETLTAGYDIAIIATGLMTCEALKAAVMLNKQGINARVVNMPTIKPLDEELVLKTASECRQIVTCEEHSIVGGLGEAVCSLLSEKQPTPVHRIGVKDVFGHSGPAREVLADYGLCADNIADTVVRLLN
jgi:transketolase